jgi:hypothetical protein
MKRVVAVAAASIDAVNAVHASVTHERKLRRGIVAPFDAAADGAAALAAGFGGAGVEGVVESSLLIEISRLYKAN